MTVPGIEIRNEGKCDYSRDRIIEVIVDVTTPGLEMREDVAIPETE